MQTFLPYKNFSKSASVLDRQRLGKQRVECWQILRALRGETKGWRNHPATKMWRGHEHALCRYAISVCDEWIRRGYNDTMRDRFVDAMTGYADTGFPVWLGNRSLHRSHRSNLIRKSPDFYAPLFPNVPDNVEYVWPE